VIARRRLNATSHCRGPSKNSPTASSCATITGRRLLTFIMRMSRGGDRRRNCSHGMRRGGLRSISPSCRNSWVSCEGLDGRDTLVVAALSLLFFRFRPPSNPHCLMRKVCPDQLLFWRILADYNVLSILGGRAKVEYTIQIV
jgi:hypothetical protein